MHVASPASRCRASATHVEFCGLASERTSECTTSEALVFDNISYRPVLGLEQFDNIVYLMTSHSWGIFCVVVAQDRAATESQQLLDTLREHSARRLSRTWSSLAAPGAHQADRRAAATACWRRGRAAIRSWMQPAQSGAAREGGAAHFREAGAMRDRRRVAQLGCCCRADLLRRCRVEADVHVVSTA